MNFAPDGGPFETQESRQRHVLTFMEMRHFLALARQYGETELAKRITDVNKFHVRLTNMVLGRASPGYHRPRIALAVDGTRQMGMRLKTITGVCHVFCFSSKVRAADPTSRILLNHYASHYDPGSDASLVNLLVNIVFARNTMSAEVIRICEQGQLPWLEVMHGRLTELSKKAADEVFLKLGGRVFFRNVEPMKSRSKSPRRGWGELVSELVSFARRAGDLARLWQGEGGVQAIAREIRKVSGFGGKGFRMKETVDGEVLQHLFSGTYARCLTPLPRSTSPLQQDCARLC